MNARRSANGSNLVAGRAASSSPHRVLSEASFHRTVSLERMRSHRSGQPILMMLLDVGGHPNQKDCEILATILRLLGSSTRETDVTGWYKAKAMIGVLFTEIGTEDRATLLNSMFVRVSKTLRQNLSSQQFSRINILFRFFPGETEHGIAEEKVSAIPVAAAITSPSFLSPATRDTSPI